MHDLNRLRVLRELKHRGTLAAVAAALCYSPSSVSHQLSQLETEVGVPLLERVGRRVRLTAHAEILVSHVEAVLERLERADADIATASTELSGTLRMASFQTAARAVVPAAITLLRELHPKVRVHLTESEPRSALNALFARDFDLVIAEEYPGNPYPRPPEVEQEVLCEDQLRVAVPGNVRVRASADALETLRTLADHAWVMEPEGTAARQWAISLCRSAGFEPDVRFDATDIFLHRRLAEEGHAAAILPDLVWGGEAPTIALRELPRGQRSRRIFTLVRSGRSTHPAVTALRAALKQAVVELQTANAAMRGTG